MQERELNPKELMRLAKEGDESALSALYELYFTPVYRYLRLRVPGREDCEDLAQTVFLKAYQAMPNFEERDRSPLAYFFTIARNAAIDYWRKQKNHSMRVGEAVFEIIADDRERTDRGADEAERRREAARALAKLAKEPREILTLRFINELSNKEIASITGKSQDAIRQIQSRALRALRKEMSEHHD